MAPSLAANANRWSRDLQPVRPTFDSKYIFSNPNCFVLFSHCICLFVIVFVRYYAVVSWWETRYCFTWIAENPVGLPMISSQSERNAYFLGLFDGHLAKFSSNCSPNINIWKVLSNMASFDIHSGPLIGIWLALWQFQPQSQILEMVTFFQVAKWSSKGTAFYSALLLPRFSTDVVVFLTKIHASWTWNILF